MRMTEQEIIRRLRRAGDQYAPLTIGSLKEKVRLQMGFGGDQADAIISFSIQDGPSFEALVELAPAAGPKSIEGRSRQLFDYISKYGNPDVIPMIIAPYMKAEQSKILADRGISWIDLSGNMSIRVPNRIYIERTGRPNRFPDTAPIKKIFQGTSALVSRALLLKPEGFSSLKEIFNFIINLNAEIKLPTVSKVLKSLEEELLINRSNSLISVPDPEKLLERLAEGYKNSTERKRRSTYRFSIGDLDHLSPGMFDVYPDYLACGFYAAQIRNLAVADNVAIFVKDVEQFKGASWKEKGINITPDAEFGNLIITETRDPGVWFNAEVTGLYAVVDDIELYLEMMVDTPRGPKIAEQLKERILQKWAEPPPKGAGSSGPKAN